MISNQLLKTSTIYSDSPQSSVRLIRDYTKNDEIYLQSSDIFNAYTTLRLIDKSIEDLNLSPEELQRLQDILSDISFLVTQEQLALVAATIPDASKLVTKEELKAVRDAIPSVVDFVTNTTLTDRLANTIITVKDWTTAEFARLTDVSLINANVQNNIIDIKSNKTAIQLINNKLMGINGKVSDYVHEVITDAINNLDFSLFIPVTELPAEGRTNKIYLLALNIPEQSSTNRWEEWIYTQKPGASEYSWELLGVLKAEIESLITKEWLEKNYLPLRGGDVIDKDGNLTTFDLKSNTIFLRAIDGITHTNIMVSPDQIYFNTNEIYIDCGTDADDGVHIRTTPDDIQLRKFLSEGNFRSEVYIDVQSKQLSLNMNGFEPRYNQTLLIEHGEGNRPNLRYPVNIDGEWYTNISPIATLDDLKNVDGFLPIDGSLSLPGKVLPTKHYPPGMLPIFQLATSDGGGISLNAEYTHEHSDGSVFNESGMGVYSGNVILRSDIIDETKQIKSGSEINCYGDLLQVELVDRNTNQRRGIEINPIYDRPLLRYIHRSDNGGSDNILNQIATLADLQNVDGNFLPVDGSQSLPGGVLPKVDPGNPDKFYDFSLTSNSVGGLMFRTTRPDDEFSPQAYVSVESGGVTLDSSAYRGSTGNFTHWCESTVIANRGVVLIKAAAEDLSTNQWIEQQIRLDFTERGRRPTMRYTTEDGKVVNGGIAILDDIKEIKGIITGVRGEKNYTRENDLSVLGPIGTEITSSAFILDGGTSKIIFDDGPVETLPGSGISFVNTLQIVGNIFLRGTSGRPRIIWKEGGVEKIGRIATLDDVPDSSNFVTIDTAQVITGEKEFAEDVLLHNDARIRCLDSADRSMNLIRLTSGDVVIVGDIGYSRYSVQLHSDAAITRNITGGSYYTMWDASNSNLSTVDWAAKNINIAGSVYTGGKTIGSDGKPGIVVEVSGNVHIASAETPVINFYRLNSTTVTGSIRNNNRDTLATQNLVPLVPNTYALGIPGMSWGEGYINNITSNDIYINKGIKLNLPIGDDLTIRNGIRYNRMLLDYEFRDIPVLSFKNSDALTTDTVIGNIPGKLILQSGRSKRAGVENGVENDYAPFPLTHRVLKIRSDNDPILDAGYADYEIYSGYNANNVDTNWTVQDLIASGNISASGITLQGGATIDGGILVAGASKFASGLNIAGSEFMSITTDAQIEATTGNVILVGPEIIIESTNNIKGIKLIGSTDIKLSGTQQATINGSPILTINNVEDKITEALPAAVARWEDVNSSRLQQVSSHLDAAWLEIDAIKLHLGI